MGKALKIVLIIILVIVLIIAGIGIYLYQFHVFKTMRICITNNEQDSQFPCNSNQECIDYLKDNFPEINQALETAPELIKNKINLIINEAVLCETTCKIKEVRGLNFEEEIPYCNPDEKEFLVKIRRNTNIKILKQKSGELP